MKKKERFLKEKEKFHLNAYKECCHGNPVISVKKNICPTYYCKVHHVLVVAENLLWLVQNFNFQRDWVWMNGLNTVKAFPQKL